MAGFSWAAAADVGSGIAGAISSWGTASANRIVQKANADAQRVVQEGQNKVRASNLSLAATMRSQQYRAILTNAGQDFNNMSEVMARTQQAWTRHDFNQGLRFAEQSGAVTARAAAAGVGGASIRAMSNTVRLQQERLQQQDNKRESLSMYEMVKQQTGVIPAAVSRLDVSPLTANMDYSPVFNQSGSSSMDLLGAIVQGLSGKTKSLQVALDSIDYPGTAPETPALTTGDFARADRALFSAQASTIQID